MSFSVSPSLNCTSYTIVFVPSTARTSIITPCITSSEKVPSPRRKGAHTSEPTMCTSQRWAEAES